MKQISVIECGECNERGMSRVGGGSHMPPSKGASRQASWQASGRGLSSSWPGGGGR